MKILNETFRHFTHPTLLLQVTPEEQVVDNDGQYWSFSGYDPHNFEDESRVWVSRGSKKLVLRFEENK